jgi:hypothetical protein
MSEQTRKGGIATGGSRVIGAAVVTARARRCHGGRELLQQRGGRRSRQILGCCSWLRTDREAPPVLQSLVFHLRD